MMPIEGVISDNCSRKSPFAFIQDPALQFTVSLLPNKRDNEHGEGSLICIITRLGIVFNKSETIINVNRNYKSVRAFWRK